MKRIQKFIIAGTSQVGSNQLLHLKAAGAFLSLEDIRPGQFVEVRCNVPDVMLRRPISVCDVPASDSLDLLIKAVGKGSSYLVGLQSGSEIDIVLPLGNGFNLEGLGGDSRVLLVGGGVGIAPLVMLSRKLLKEGVDVTVVLGGRSRIDVEDALQLFEKKVRCICTTDDGSYGTKGVVTDSDVFGEDFDRIFCCGPTPMMKAVAAVARGRDIDCQVSLENMMACGLGACLCCVEKTVDGNLCVCTDGPVFNIDKLLWK